MEAIWMAIPVEYQVAVGVGVPLLGGVAAWLVKRTKTDKDDRLLEKAKAAWRKMRGQ